MGNDNRLRTLGAELIAALGLVFVVAGLATWYGFVLPEADTTSAAMYALVTHVLFGVVTLALGLHTERSDLGADERFDVMAWCFSGFLFLVVLALWGNLGVVRGAGLTEAVVSDVVVFGSLGGAFGAVAGVNWGRSARNAELAARNEEQRETLVLLTRLLRHDIRNDLMAISGHADVVAEYVDDEVAGSLDVIQQRTDAILRLLGDTDALVETLGGEREFERMDLSTILREEVASLDGANPTVDVESSVPDGLTVVADGLIHQLFSNLLENAVAHNDPGELTVRLDAARLGDTVEVVVADDGVGIPGDLRGDVFELGEQGEGSTGDGLGLYLVSRLADVYGGDVVLTEADDGATFRVRLPAAPET